MSNELTMQNVERLVESRMAEERTKYEKQIAERDRSIKSMSGERAELTMKLMVTASAEKADVLPGATEDVLRNVKKAGGKLTDNGELVFLSNQGYPRRSISDPTKDMQLDDFISDVLIEQKPFLFKSSSEGHSLAARKSVRFDDQFELGRNLESIASGRTKVTY